MRGCSSAFFSTFCTLKIYLPPFHDAGWRKWVHALILHEFFLFIKVSQQGFDLILLSCVVYYCNYIFCNIVKHFTLINKIISENVWAYFTFDPIRPLFNSPCVKHWTPLKHQRASQSHLILYQPFMVTEKVSITSHHRPLVLYLFRSTVQLSYLCNDTIVWRFHRKFN